MIKTLLQLLKIGVAVVLLYLAYFSYRKQQATSSQSSQQQLAYYQYNLDLYPEFHARSFIDYRSGQKPARYQLNENNQAVEINGGQVSYASLRIEHEDALHIQSVTELQGSQGCFRIQSRFFTLLYCKRKESVCYQKIGLGDRHEYYFVDTNKDIWIFTHPNNNVLILRIFECREGGLMKHSHKIVQDKKINIINNIQFTKDGNIAVSALTFSRNSVAHEFNSQSYSLMATTHQITHNIQELQKKINGFKVQISQQIKVDKFYETIYQLLYEVSGGRLGKPATKPYREVQKQYDIQVLDYNNNVLLELNRTQQRYTLISLSDILLPFRSPVFISKEHYQLMQPVEKALNVTNNTQTIDFKIYEIRSKGIKEMKNQIGVYKVVPDSSVHFLAFDPKFLTLYPQENINKDEYYTIRSEKGGIVMKGSKIQGMFSEQPIQSSSTTIRYGMAEGEVYQQLTTNAKEMAPGIYESHIIHKAMFTYHKKNRMELITSMTGKNALTYYFNHAKGYTYSTSFIENNEFWVFEHHNTSAPLITKYELFLNVSAPKSVMSIKRNYDLPITGRITKVQKCIDGFYYFDYVSAEGKYGVARAHHALMSNRQPHPQGKEAGAFEKAMIIKDIERNQKLKISSSQQKILTLELNIDQAVVGSWREMQLKHQFSVLPYRVYSSGSTYFMFNIRKMLIEAYDTEMTQIEQKTHLTNTIVLGLFGVLVLIIVALAKSGQPSRQQTQQQSAQVNSKSKPEIKKA